MLPERSINWYILFKDLNGDGIINDNDKAYIGNPLHACLWLTNDFSLQRFRSQYFLQGMKEISSEPGKRNMEAINGYFESVYHSAGTPTLRKMFTSIHLGEIYLVPQKKRIPMCPV
jgi:hypothetical protein